MTFREENIEEFLRIFAEAKIKILNCEGCEDLELLRDTFHTSTLFTLSKWQGAEDLERYRNSELFKTTWAKTKILFSEKAEAWSLESVS